MTTTYIGLVRGINVGGNRGMKMDVLRSVVTEAGWSDVATYIQSGNVVFRGPKQREAEVAAGIESGIEHATGFDVAVVVRTLAAFTDALSRNPFGDRGAKLEHLHFVFLRDALDEAALGRLDLPGFAPDELATGDGVVYLHLPEGLGRSKLGAAMTPRNLGGPVTVRNWNTVTKLVEMGEAAGSQAAHTS